MADDAHERQYVAAHSEERGSAPPLGAREFWRLISPWLGYVFLAAAGILGLFTASGAPDSVTYSAGIATFVVAALIIAVRMNRQLDGREVGLLLPVAVTGADGLAVEIAVLAVLGIVGAILAAAVGGALYGLGLALLVVCAGLIFNEIRRYFDAVEGRH